MTDAPKRRTFRKFTFRGVDLDKLMDLDSTQIMDLMHSRVRRRFARGLKRKPMGLIKRLRKVGLPACPVRETRQPGGAAVPRPEPRCCAYAAMAGAQPRSAAVRELTSGGRASVLSYRRRRHGSTRARSPTP